MVRMVVTSEQAQILTTANEKIELFDDAGNRLGVVARPISEADVALAQKRAESNQPYRTTKEVLERLKSLEQQ